MPRKTNTVMSIVDRTWSNRALAVFGSPPHQFSANTCAFSAKIATTTKVRIGTILATVTILLMTAAPWTPREMRMWKIHRPTEPSASAASVSPWLNTPGHTSPRVEEISTQYVTFPTHALAQYPNAEKKPRYSPKPAFAYAYTPASSPGLRTARVWNTNASISMPVPAITQAIRAPNPPVARAKLRGREKTPAPTIDPTTIAISVVSGNFRTSAGASVSTAVTRPPPAVPGPPHLRGRRPWGVGGAQYRLAPVRVARFSRS